MLSQQLDVNLQERVAISLYKEKGNGNSPVLSVGIKNYKNMAVLTAGSLYCGTNAARSGREYRHILLLYIFVEFIRVYYTETLPSFPSWNLTDELSRTL
jgi:hypothetical protein